MTDDEINRRVAEKEGWWKSDLGWYHPAASNVTLKGAAPPSFTDDWTLTGPLIEKYHVTISWGSVCGWAAWIHTKPNPLKWETVVKPADDPRKAACLAVLSMNEENNE